MRTPLEKALDRHLKHADPHPQYLKRTELPDLGGAQLTTDRPATVQVGAAGAAGDATTAARADHEHPSPSIATETAAGFMSAADKAKLNALRTNGANDARYARIDSGVVWDADNGTPVVDFASGLPSQVEDAA